jgi:glycosyltransferase involved in cell wall biosynthesis
VRIVLLALDGEPERAASSLRALHPRAEIKILTRAEVSRGNLFARLRALRAHAPDAFAVSTERLVWQQGQNALLLFGALAGARRVILLDRGGASRAEQSLKVLSLAPFRFARESWASAGAGWRARRELARLERAVAGGAFPARAARARDTSAEGARGASGATRITYLRATPAAGTQAGGATSHINGFIGGALELGARVRVISNDPIAGLDADGVELKIIDPQPFGLTRPLFDLRNALLFAARACREIESDPPDLIYQRYSRFNWAGVEASLRTGRPLFLEYNGSEVWMGRHWDRAGLFSLLERAERLNLAAASRVFVVADVERRNLERAGVPADKIVVNPNGVDVRRFRPGVGGREARARLGVGADETLVGFVGTFGPWHGATVLARAFNLIPREDGVRLLLVGTGSLHESVEDVLREGGALGRAHFAGAVAHEEVPALLDACDVLASPHVPPEDGSEFFGSPTKLFEYMAAGKAIVASRLGQIAEVLTDEETALLVEPGDARALADALLRLSRARELRARLGAAAREVGVERHTWTRNAGRVLDAYRALGG